MHWLSIFDQSFYSSRIVQHTNFIIFGALQLWIWVKQVCIHLKTHFKFQFNSPRNFTTSAHFIFFLHTTLYQDPNKIGTTQFGFIKLDIQFLQNINQIWVIWTILWILSHCQAGSTCQLAHASATRKIGDMARSTGTRRSLPTAASPATMMAPAWPPRPPVSIGTLTSHSTDP